jgi:hypothetical protein
MANLMPGEWELQTQAAQRKRKFAEALIQQQQPQGQMVGGMYGAPSITQNIASLLNQYQGGKMMNEADQMERSAIENQRATYKSAAERLAESLKGKTTPAVTGNNTDDVAYMGNPGFYQPQQTKPPTIDDLMRAQVQYAQDIGDPNAMGQAVSGMINYQGKQQDRADDIAFRTQNREDEQAYRAQQSAIEREARAGQLREQIAAREQAGRESADLRRELAQMQMQNSRDLAAMSAANRPSPTPVSVMGPDGKPVYVSPANAYGRQPYNAKQEAADAVKVQQQEQARISAQQVLDQASNIYSHPGRQAGTGASSFMSRIPGTEARGFQANLDTFKAQTFVPMVSALKGMGALSDAEGKKLAESVGALDPSMPEREFENSIKGITKTLYDKAKASGLNVSLPDFAAGKTQGVKRYNPATGRIE